jgi:dipeptidyl aminopeptidase/acylaminoacyl peptidase
MRHTQAIRLLLPIVVGAIALLIGGASAPAASKADDVVGNDSPSWAPSGDSIAFTSFRSGNGDIYVMRPNGDGQRRLTTSPSYDDLPAWSPDGRKIAFTSSRSGSLQIWVMDADGSNQTQLTDSSGTNYFSTWSPDSSRIAFRSDRDGNSEIYSMRADGSDVRRLTSDPSVDFSPSWGPDGRILFVSNRTTGGKASLWVMNGDGSDQHRITPRSFVWNERTPVWSPDGTKLLYQAERDFPLGNTELYVMNADSTRPRRLTSYPGQDNWPTWSPDGRQIAFARGPTPFRNEIYVMNADGTRQREVTVPKIMGVAFGTFPARPIAGRNLIVEYDVAEVSGADIGFPKVSCAARLGGRRLRVAASRFARATGRATCTWRLPASARGKRFAGTITVHSESGVLSHRFSFAVR